MKVSINESWHQVLRTEFDKPYFKELTDFVKKEYNETTCFPVGSEIFNAFELCSFDDVKVVVLGQDPYINPGQAHGLCFSVKEGTKLPPSLKNIYKELSSDIGIEEPQSGNLTHWAEQGVLLLNDTLTVRQGESNSHSKKGWEKFTDAVITNLNQKKERLVYVLWGSSAQKKAAKVNSEKNLILTSVHPSPLSAYRGFFGCKHFSKTNDYLKKYGQNIIEW